MNGSPARRSPGIEHELHGSISGESFSLQAGSLQAEVRHLNEQLLEKVDLLSRSRADLDQFAWTVSHDLKEPLRLVSSYAQLLIRRRENSPDPDEQEFVEYIRVGVARIHALIEGLLEYASAARRQTELPGVANANVVAAEAVQSFGDVVKETGAMITIGSLPAVKVNPPELLQVFQSLIGNALKFRKPGESPRLRISAAESDGEVRFAVRDHGIGIKPEHHDRIFMLFQRLHGSEYPGIGLGLALCKRLVEAHGGRIWLESEQGASSTFYFTLPVAQACQPGVRKAASMQTFPQAAWRFGA